MFNPPAATFQAKPPEIICPAVKGSWTAPDAGRPHSIDQG